MVREICMYIDYQGNVVVYCHNIATQIDMYSRTGEFTQLYQSIGTA